MVKRMLFGLLTVALCLMWNPLVSASAGCGHEQEIKQFVCSMPVMVFEYVNAEALTNMEPCIKDVSAVHSHDKKFSSMPYMILEKRCARISRGKLFSSVSEARRHNLEGCNLKPKKNYPVRFRLYNLIC